MIKSLLVSCLLFGACCIGVGVSLFPTKNVENVSAETNDAGQLAIYLYYFTYGGSYNRYKDNPECKFIYNKSLHTYSLEIVLFAGDYFAPNITGKGAVPYSTKLSDETKSRLLEQNITMHTGGAQFHVNKSGTYSINISDNIEFYSSTNDYYKIWDDSMSSVIYLSDSVNSSKPIGNNAIYLIGNFDGAGWDGSQYPERKFWFNKTTNKYEFEFNLYKGDIFVPQSSDHGRLKYYKSEYTDELFHQNNLDMSSDGYFICTKDGAYHFSIDYKVEYILDPAFLWSKDIGSTMVYSKELLPNNIRGNETIVITGMINGVEYMSNTTTNKFHYDPITKQYKIKLYLYKGDHICPYLQNKGKKAYYRAGNKYLNDMCSGSSITSITVSNIPNFEINISGNYEIAIGDNVENLRDESMCWLEHGNSYIRLSSGKSSAAYFAMGSYSTGSNKVFANGNGDIKQYGLNGSQVYPVNFISLNSGNAKGSILKVNYDSTYTKKINITNTIDEDNKTLEITPDINYGYNFENGQKDYSLGKACEFLSNLSDAFSYVKVGDKFVADYSVVIPENAESIIKQYSLLDNDSKTYVDEALINTVGNGGKEAFVHYLDIEPYLSSIVNENKSKETTTLMLYIIVLVLVSIVALFVVLSAKRKRSNKKTINQENSNDINIKF